MPACPYANNNLSKYNLNLGDTTAANHANIDRIASFSGFTWVNSDYNSDFGDQWCFVDSFLVDKDGKYAAQRITSAQTSTILATRYCTKGTWGNWDVGVTKSDLDPLFAPCGELTTSADSAGIGCWIINSDNPVNGISDGILLCFAPFANLKTYLQFLYGSDNTRGRMYVRVCWYGVWRNWVGTTVS